MAKKNPRSATTSLKTNFDNIAYSKISKLCEENNISLRWVKKDQNKEVSFVTDLEKIEHIKSLMLNQQQDIGFHTMNINNDFSIVSIICSSTTDIYNIEKASLNLF